MPAPVKIFKRIFLAIMIVVCLLLAGYFLQPVPRGEGYDRSTRYEQETSWPALPEAMAWGSPSGLGIDTAQNIVVFHRAGREWGLWGMPEKPIEHPTVCIIGKDDGRIKGQWGANRFIMPHGLTVDHRNHIWVTDVGLHQVFQFSHEGKLLLRLGTAGVPGSDSSHFNRPTDIAVTPDGSFYVSDGYGNSRIIKFSREGKYLFEWGVKGTEPGAFDIPHALTLGPQGQVIVADRENGRIQAFDASGKFLREWKHNSVGALFAVCYDSSASKLLAVDDVSFLHLVHRGADVLVLDTAGGISSRFGRSGMYAGPKAWYHDIVADREGNIYVADMLGHGIQKFRKVPGKRGDTRNREKL